MGCRYDVNAPDLADVNPDPETVAVRAASIAYDSSSSSNWEALAGPRKTIGAVGGLVRVVGGGGGGDGGE